MGRWGSKPWEGDRAGEWFHTMMNETHLADFVEKTLHQLVDEDFPEVNDEIRAAATMLILLGIPEVWPFEHLKQDLELAIARLEQLLTTNNDGGAKKQIRAEIAVLKSRLDYKAMEHPERVKWWQFDEYQ